MDSSFPRMLAVHETSQIFEVRRLAVLAAQQLNFTEERAGAIAIIANELSTNVLKHAGGGQLQIRSIFAEPGQPAAVELLAIDKGRGMRDVNACLHDGYSTTATAGTGLGAVRRLAAEFDIYSQPEKGTVVAARVTGTADSNASGFRTGVVQTPARGETVCGDAWSVSIEPGAVTVLVADGLGHGPFAAQASQAAVRSVAAGIGREPGELIDAVHAALRPTRGAAVAVARIEPGAGRLRYAGLGNIGALVFTPSAVQRPVSHNGTAGAQARRVQQFEYRWPESALLIMYSDGLTSHWDLSMYAGLHLRHPSVIAGVLYRDFVRGRDDATVVVVKASE